VLCVARGDEYLSPRSIITTLTRLGERMPHANIA
jgi:hypothetical protein